MSSNFATRFFDRQAGYFNQRFDRKYIHSNFSVSNVLKSREGAPMCCDFTPCGSKLISGDMGGIALFDLNDNSEKFCHYSDDDEFSLVDTVACSRDGRLLLTSCENGPTMTAVWNIGNRCFTQLITWNEKHLEFPNLNQDRVLATFGERATIYDITTGQKMFSLGPVEPKLECNNQAKFCPSDQLILSSNILWDVSSGKEIHKFERQYDGFCWSMFHPNELEIIINTTVWDLRTFRLLRTVPELNECYFKFSTQHVMYAWSDMGASFCVLDAYDYSCISSKVMKPMQVICDLAINQNGNQIAVAQVHSEESEFEVRIYNVGHKKNDTDE